MVSAAALTQYLERIDFPATKEDLLKHIREQNPPSDIMNEFKAMPEGTYHSVAGVWDAIGGLS